MYNGVTMIRYILAAALTASSAFAVESFPTSAGTLQLTPIQHASLMIQAGGKTLYVDPAEGGYDSLPKADYILITDIHGDHLAPPIVNKLKRPDTVIVAPKAVAAQLVGVKVLSNGEKTTVGPFAVEAVPMYNLTRGPSAGQLSTIGAEATGISSLMVASASTFRATPRLFRK
jgi:L-ascorbate metabolism protein UlaG (beta-lactamase superfamily)